MADKFRGNIDELQRHYKREYNDALASRHEYDGLLTEWDRQYEAKPRQAERDFPWPGASNLEVPEAASHTDTVYSRLDQQHFATTPHSVIKEYDTKFTENCYALQRFVNEITLRNAGYRRETSHSLLGMAKLGTSFQWCSYDTETYFTWRNGHRHESRVHEGPIHRYLSTRQVIVPPDARDEQKCRWIAVRSYKTWGELVHDARKLGYPSSAMDQISSKGQIINNIAAREGEHESGIHRSGTLEQWEVVQIFARYFNEREAQLEEVWLTMTYPDCIILKAEYAPYHHMLRPLTKYNYMIREGAFYGIGIVGMLSTIQEEISTIHNYILDAMLFCNAPMLKGPVNSQSKITVHPGAYLPYLSRPEEFEVFRAGDVYPSGYTSENSARGIGERRTGIGDASLQHIGSFRGASGVRTPATTTMALLGESNKRFALSIALAKEADTALLRQHVGLLRQFWPRMRSLAYAWNPPLARKIDALMALPYEAFVQNTAFEPAMSTTAINQEAEQQKLIALAPIVAQHNGTFLQLVMQMKQLPQLEKEIRQVLDKTSLFMTKLLHTFDIRNAEEFVLDVDEAANIDERNSQGAIDGITAGFLNGATSNGNGDGEIIEAETVNTPPNEVNFFG